MKANVKDNKITIEAIKYALSRKDKLGELMVEVVADCIPSNSRETLLSDPFSFTNYYVFNKIRDRYNMVFSNELWFLCLSDKRYEGRLVKTLNYESFGVDISDIPADIARAKVRERVAKFKHLFPRYRAMETKEAEDFLDVMGI